MDKNKIHIDDLVRSRLNGAEEREPAGAWSTMRELLDKEMPVETAAFNWRRMLGYTTALLLAAAVSVGGYNYYRHATTALHDAPAALASSSSSATAPNNNHPAMAAHAANSQSFTLNHSTSAAPAVAASALSAPTGQSANHNAVKAARTASVVSIKSAHHKNLTPDQAGDAGMSTAAVVASSGSPMARPAAPISPERELQAAAMEAPKAGPLKSSAASNVSTHRQAEPPAPASPSVLPAPGNIAAAKGNDLSAIVLHKDTIRQIEIVYHRAAASGLRTLQYVKDTIAITDLVVDRPIPAPAPKPQPKEAKQPLLAVAQQSVPAPAKPKLLASASSSPATAAPANPVPQAAAASSAEAVAATDNIRLVSLSQFRVASRFSKLWNAERFLLMVQSVKTDLAHAQFYAGITGGLNASLFTSTAMAGFQAGLAGLLTFSDQWSLAGELKFYQRFNTGNSIKDNYVAQDNWAPGNYSTVNGVSYREWSWRQDTVAHSYNFTTVQTLELPLLLRYNAGRFFAEAGVNLMYAFTVNADEIEKPYGNPALVSKQMPATFTPESVSGNKPSINLKDFGSRFGMGYALGVGYEITPALQCNLRLVYNVWDNTTGVGAQKVSQYLYQTPSIQVSVGYRFKQGKAR